MDYKKIIDELLAIMENNEKHFEDLTNKAMSQGNIHAMSIMNAQCAGWTGARYALESLLEKEDK
jgi:acid stress-induced BolA-like protein IbaG/YrbA